MHIIYTVYYITAYYIYYSVFFCIYDMYAILEVTVICPYLLCSSMCVINITLILHKINEFPPSGLSG